MLSEAINYVKRTLKKINYLKNRNKVKSQKINTRANFSLSHCDLK